MGDVVPVGDVPGRCGCALGICMVGIEISIGPILFFFAKIQTKKAVG